MAVSRSVAFFSLRRVDWRPVSEVYLLTACLREPHRRVDAGLANSSEVAKGWRHSLNANITVQGIDTYYFICYCQESMDICLIELYSYKTYFLKYIHMRKYNIKSIGYIIILLCYNIIVKKSTLLIYLVNIYYYDI